jgi:hypothetical protein
VLPKKCNTWRDIFMYCIWSTKKSPARAFIGVAEKDQITILYLLYKFGRPIPCIKDNE